MICLSLDYNDNVAALGVPLAGRLKILLFDGSSARRQDLGEGHRPLEASG